jgi:PAS domain-containing protein
MLKKPTYEVLERKIKELEARAGRCELAEKVLEESEAKYQILFENAGTATIIVEEDNTITMVNPEL